MVNFDDLSIEFVNNATWEAISPYFDALQADELNAQTVDAWMLRWTKLSDVLSEVLMSLNVTMSRNTADNEAEASYTRFITDILPHFRKASQTLKEKFLASGLTPTNFEIPLRNMRAEAALYREENLPLMTQEEKLRTQFEKITGAQTFLWEGTERPIPALLPLLQNPDRAQREAAWRLAQERQLVDRGTLNELWTELLALRQEIAANAGYADYRAYAWVSRLRFDYTPEDSLRFHDAIEEVVTPAVKKILERQRQRLGVDTIRPWDLAVETSGSTPLRPFSEEEEFIEKSAAIFHKLDPQLGDYFDLMRDGDYLDLMSRKNKRPGGYCASYPVSKRPFIFMNSVGVNDNVRTLTHEAGHAFHAFEKFNLPYQQQRAVTAEFNEVASMAMELLTTPFWSQSQGGYYSETDAARARIEHLEKIVQFWAYMAVVDGFQHWAYTHAEEAAHPANCDAAWSALWDRFMGAEDWSGLEDYKATGWHRKLHIFTYPFYYVEYGMAQLGSVQIWANMLKDQPRALAAYKESLALGGTRSLPDLYAAAGAKFEFTAETLRPAIDLLMQTIDELEAQL